MEIQTVLVVDEDTDTCEGEFQTRRIITFYSFIRNISTICMGFLALFVSLKSSNDNDCSKIFFTITIALFGLSILFSLITQYGEIDYLRKSENARLKILLEYNESANGISKQSEAVYTGKLYVFSEKLTYYCLGLSILSLTVYSFFL